MLAFSPLTGPRSTVRLNKPSHAPSKCMSLRCEQQPGRHLFQLAPLQDCNVLKCPHCTVLTRGAPSSSLHHSSALLSADHTMCIAGIRDRAGYACEMVHTRLRHQATHSSACARHPRQQAQPKVLCAHDTAGEAPSQCDTWSHVSTLTATFAQSCITKLAWFQRACVLAHDHDAFQRQSRAMMASAAAEQSSQQWRHITEYTT